MHFCRSPLCLAGRNWTFHTHVRLEQWCTNCFSVVLDLMMRQLIRLSSQNPAELLGWLNTVMNGLLFIISVSTVYQQVTEVSRTGLHVWHSFVWMPRLHALGMGHEQARPDRDDYVTVHWQNIKSGMASQFDKKLGMKWNEGYWRLGRLCFLFGAWTVRVGRRFWTRFDQSELGLWHFLGVTSWQGSVHEALLLSLR